MIIVLYYILILLLSTNPRSKSIKTLSFLLLLILFCLNTQIADRDGYQQDMEMVSSGLTVFEPLWSAILVFFDSHSISLQYLYAFVGLVYIPTLYYVLGKISNKNSKVIACYMIGVFFMDVVQLRFTFSISFILWGVYSLFTIEGKRGVVFFIICLITAMSVHLSSFVFILFLFAKYLNIKKTIVYTITGGILMFLISSLAIGYFGDLFDIALKVQRISEADSTSSHYFLTTTITSIMILIMALVARYYNTDTSNRQEKRVDLAYKIAILSLICIPLLSFSPDIRRHIYVFYLIISALIYSGHPYFKRIKIVELLPMIIAFLFFMLTVFTGNRETVFFPLFENNLLF